RGWCLSDFAGSASRGFYPEPKQPFPCAWSLWCSMSNTHQALSPRPQQQLPSTADSCSASPVCQLADTGCTERHGQEKLLAAARVDQSSAASASLKRSTPTISISPIFNFFGAFAFGT